MSISGSPAGWRASRQRLATGLGAGSVVVFTVVALTGLAGGNSRSGDDDGFGLLAFWLLTLMYAVVGVAIARRDPGNAIGWIFLGLSLWVSSTWALGFALSAVGRPEAAEVIGHSAWIPPVVIPATWVLLIFPDGRPLTPRWRVLIFITLLGTLGFALQIVFGEFLGGAEEYGPNPFYIELIDRVSSPAALLMVVSLLGSVASVVVRFRRAHGVERQQIKWLAYSAALVVLTWFASGALTELGVLPLAVADLLLFVAISLIPMAIALAIVRYRLYDIDRLISRSVSYALIVPFLASVYVIGAVWLPTRLSNDSPIFVAGSTLLVAALFNPVRRRVMRWVDRRFHRTRYDADKISDDFARELRDQVDPRRVAEHWTATVTATMQPSSVGVWIRDVQGNLRINRKTA
ncbi:MAG TPA: hypothetical protein VFS66_00175 [Acidimicrobiia bacterium]|nr:hypothetical protein [Acidimicrobiia bacterium]